MKKISALSLQGYRRGEKVDTGVTPSLSYLLAQGSWVWVPAGGVGRTLFSEGPPKRS